MKFMIGKTHQMALDISLTFCTFFNRHLYNFSLPSILQYCSVYLCFAFYTPETFVWWSTVMQDIFKISKTVAIVFRYNPSLIIDKLHLFCKSIHLSILSPTSFCRFVPYGTTSVSLSLSLYLSLSLSLSHSLSLLANCYVTYSFPSWYNIL